MRPEIMDIICQVLQEERDHARDIVEAIVDAEQNYLFTNDLDYKENRSSIVPTEDNLPPNQRGPGGPNGPNNQPNYSNQ